MRINMKRVYPQDQALEIHLVFPRHSTDHISALRCAQLKYICNWNAMLARFSEIRLKAMGSMNALL